jgi:hypothetical protein
LSFPKPCGRIWTDWSKSAQFTKETSELRGKDLQAHPCRWIAARRMRFAVKRQSPAEKAQDLIR